LLRLSDKLLDMLKKESRCDLSPAFAICAAEKFFDIGFGLNISRSSV
jgi:hypothetical protein